MSSQLRLRFLHSHMLHCLLACWRGCAAPGVLYALQAADQRWFPTEMSEIIREWKLCRYVGGAPGKIVLYVGKEVVRRGVVLASRFSQTFRFEFSCSMRQQIAEFTRRKLCLVQTCAGLTYVCYCLQASPWRVPAMSSSS